MTYSDRSEVITCARCASVLTKPVAQLNALPKRSDNEMLPPHRRATVPRGAWAVDPDPFLRTENGAPCDTVGTLVVAPLDGLDLEVHPDWRRDSGCCGHDGCDGPNCRCPSCGAEVATLMDDCWTPVELRFEPDAVVVRSATSAEHHRP